MAMAPTQKSKLAVTKPSEMEVLLPADRRAVCFCTQSPRAIMRLSRSRSSPMMAPSTMAKMDEAILPAQTSADAKEQYTQGYSLHDDGLQTFPQLDAASGQHAGKTSGQPGQQQPRGGAGQNSQRIDKGTNQYHVSLSFSKRSRTTALPRRSPAAAGTQGLLAGTLRRPGGGVSGWAGETGFSGLNTTFRW